MLFKDDEVARADAMAVRNACGWYRWTHGTIDVRGADATELLDHLLVNTVATCKVGRERYTTMLDETGGIIDDLMAMRLSNDHWWLSTLYGPQMMRWIAAHKGDADVIFEDITLDIDMYSVQGPRSVEAMDQLVADPVDGLKRFQIVDTRVGDVDVRVDRGGFTGELGFEIYCRRADSGKIADALRATGAHEVYTLEVYVRSLPMEKGMALRQDYHHLTPFEANLGWSVHFDQKGDFIGRAALEQAEKDGPRWAFMGVEIERESYEDIAQNEIVRKRGIPVGKCRQMIYGYTVDKNVGFAVVDAKKCPIGTKVTIGPNDSPATIVEPKWC
ncbi:aminomethyltransferase family protein [Olsenella sp. Marseille-P4559]|uniref:aminomethyltransferase family protein n=1 Tax=Olsenella sp. Marseille-P4559 TaxID=2364795 RepID=UPI00102F5E2B|nr:glycine cleavage T C-terminal barrel domain-containing protein [Olsenella sp. Marseille-P4559]